MELELIGAFCGPGCVTILCDSIPQHNREIINLVLPKGELSEDDFKSIGSVLTTCSSLERLHMNCPPVQTSSEGVCLDVSMPFCKALCDTKSLKELVLTYSY